MAVIPIPYPIMGEKACAVVATKDRDRYTCEEMTAFLQEMKVAKYKLPERLEARESLPIRGEQEVAKNSLIEELKSISAVPTFEAKC